MSQHNHSHTPTFQQVNSAFVIGITLNALFVIIEFICGFVFNSVALISDAGHNLSDVAGLLLVFYTFSMAKKISSNKFTFGYKKGTILVSLLNAMMLLVAVGVIFWESISKLQSPVPVEGGIVAVVAFIGVFINSITAYLFFKNKEKDLNVKSAYLHLATDALVSLGVVISGIIIYYTSWYWIDSIMGILIGIAILLSTWGLLRDSFTLAMGGVPRHLDLEKVKKIILKVKGVKDTHHIHIWALSTTENALVAHIVVDDVQKVDEIKKDIRHELDHLGITHTTLEVDNDMSMCLVDC